MVLQTIDKRALAFLVVVNDRPLKGLDLVRSCAKKEIEAFARVKRLEIKTEKK